MKKRFLSLFFIGVIALNALAPKVHAEEDIADVYTYTVTSPSGSAALISGDTYTIRWTDESTKNLGNVSLWYSLDNGVTYTNIAMNTQNDGKYDWVVPTADSDMVLLKIEGSDLLNTVGTSTSSLFLIRSTDTPAPTEGIGVYGNSPVDSNEIQEISLVEPGDYFRGDSYATIYYLTEDGYRRPFPDEKTFLTYESDFSKVKVVTDATLPYYTLGAPMLPKAGTTLVRILSNSAVYATETSTHDDTKELLRAIPDETTAATVYGKDWTDYVFDVEPTMISHYIVGDMIDSGYEPNLGELKKTSDLQ